MFHLNELGISEKIINLILIFRCRIHKLQHHKPCVLFKLNFRLSTFSNWKITALPNTTTSILKVLLIKLIIIIIASRRPHATFCVLVIAVFVLSFNRLWDNHVCISQCTLFEFSLTLKMKVKDVDDSDENLQTNVACQRAYVCKNLYFLGPEVCSRCSQYTSVVQLAWISLP